MLSIVSILIDLSVANVPAHQSNNGASERGSQRLQDLYSLVAVLIDLLCAAGVNDDERVGVDLGSGSVCGEEVVALLGRPIGEGGGEGLGDFTVAGDGSGGGDGG